MTRLQEASVNLDVSTGLTVLNVDVTEEMTTVAVEVNLAPEVLTLDILEVGPPGPAGKDGRRHVFHSPTEPPDLQSGDVWIETGLDEPIIWLKA